MKSTRILLIEDDTVLAPLIQNFLEDHHYQVIWADDGTKGLAAFISDQPDLVILDLMLPGIDGLSLCRLIRKESPVAILMLTAKGDEADRVLGLELGADDYLTKPFGLKELLARIKAILRRCGHDPKPIDEEEIRFGLFSLHPDNRRLLRIDREIDLTRSEFDILYLLTQNPGKVFSRNDLLDCIKGGDGDSFDRAVDMHISNLRKKIETDPKSPVFLKTVWGVGYRFNP
jgi:DNA-binding response OmpR family regulator